MLCICVVTELESMILFLCGTIWQCVFQIALCTTHLWWDLGGQLYFFMVVWLYSYTDWALNELTVGLCWHVVLLLCSSGVF